MAGRRSSRVVELVCRDGNFRCIRVVGDGLKALVLLAAIRTTMAAVAVVENFIFYYSTNQDLYIRSEVLS